jgi:hypothetical protein
MHADAVFLPDEAIIVPAIRTAPCLGDVVPGAPVRELLVEPSAELRSSEVPLLINSPPLSLSMP